MSAVIQIAYTYVKQQLSNAQFKHLQGSLPTQWQQSSFTNYGWRYQHQSLYGKLLASYLLAANGYSLHGLYFNPYGKPMLPPPVHFSISHSGQLAACIITDCCAVGFDVEYVKPTNYSLLMRRFNQHEVLQINSSHDALTSFYRLWTVKEAVLKGIGIGLKMPMCHIESRGPGLVKTPKGYWHIGAVGLLAGYTACVATKKPIALPGAQCIDQNILNATLPTFMAKQ